MIMRNITMAIVKIDGRPAESKAAEAAWRPTAYGMIDGAVGSSQKRYTEGRKDEQWRNS